MNLYLGNIFQNIKVSLKITLILALMFLMIILYTNCKAYDKLSSVSACILVFSTNLYILEVNLNIKAICFLVIIFTNVIFFIPWFFSVLRINIFKYESYFMKYFPMIAVLTLTIYDTFHKIGFD